MADTQAIDTSNRFKVGVQGDYVILLSPIPQRLSRSDALNLAAHLVCMADATSTFVDDEMTFDEVLEAVQG